MIEYAKVDYILNRVLGIARGYNRRANFDRDSIEDGDTIHLVKSTHRQLPVSGLQ